MAKKKDSPSLRRGSVNKYKWPARLVKLLGKISDRELARKAGMHFQTVTDERRRRGIPPAFPHRPKVEWTQEMIDLLGEATDSDVAAELGLTADLVFRKRKSLGIPPFGRSSELKQTFWTRRRIALLGTAPDGEVAKKLRISRHIVAYRRQILGIPPFKPRAAPVQWTKPMLRRLGKQSDSSIAKRFGIAVKSVASERRRRGIPPFRNLGALPRNRQVARIVRKPTAEAREILEVPERTVYRLRKDLGIPAPKKPNVWTKRVLARLGKVPDAEIAAEIGRKASTVQRKRQKLGRRQRILRSWTPEEIALLGKLTDEEVARRTGRSQPAVGKKRLSLGIAPVHAKTHR